MEIEAHSDVSEARLTAFSQWLVQEMIFRGVGVPENFAFDGERHFFTDPEQPSIEESWYEVTLSATVASVAFGNAATGADFRFGLNLIAVEAAAADPESFYAFCSMMGQGPVASDENSDVRYMRRVVIALFQAMIDADVGIPTEIKLDGSPHFFDSVIHKKPRRGWYMIKVDASGGVGSFGNRDGEMVYPFFFPPNADDVQTGHA